MEYLERKNDLDFFIGQRVKRRRSELRMSQGRLGEKLGVSFQQIQKYENGKNRISASTLFYVSRILEVDFSYFIEGYGHLESFKDESYALYNPRGKDSKLLLDYFFQIKNQSLKTLIVDLVKNVANLPENK